MLVHWLPWSDTKKTLRILRKIEYLRTLHIFLISFQETLSKILHFPSFLSVGIISWGSCICLHSLFPRDSPSMLEDAQKMWFCYPPMLPLLPDAHLLAVLPLIPLHPLFLGGFLEMRPQLTQASSGTYPFCLLLNAPEDAASALFHQ